MRERFRFLGAISHNVWSEGFHRSGTASTGSVSSAGIGRCSTHRARTSHCNPVKIVVLSLALHAGVVNGNAALRNIQSPRLRLLKTFGFACLSKVDLVVEIFHHFQRFT